MDITFAELKYLVTVVAEDLLNDDFGNLLDSASLDSDRKHDLRDDVSDEIYDKVFLLQGLLTDLYKHRPLPF